MKTRRLWGLLLLVAVVFTTVELFVIARWKTGGFDLRCAYLRGYVLAHSYPDGKETIRCVRITP
jgi:hypothetical protein